MSKAIEMMKEDGWEINQCRHSDGYEWQTFRRPLQQPNAIVDWETLDKFILDLHTGNGFGLVQVYSGVSATLQSIAEDLERLIKKAP